MDAAYFRIAIDRTQAAEQHAHPETGFTAETVGILYKLTTPNKKLNQEQNTEMRELAAALAIRIEHHLDTRADNRPQALEQAANDLRELSDTPYWYLIQDNDHQAQTWASAMSAATQFLPELDTDEHRAIAEKLNDPNWGNEDYETEIHEHVTLPPGEYWVGDPGAVVPFEQLDNFYTGVKDATVVHQGSVCAVFDAAFGDGEYSSSQGDPFHTFSGRLAAIPMEAVAYRSDESYYSKQGRVVRTDQPLECSYDEYGTVHFNDISINTSGRHS